MIKYPYSRPDVSDADIQAVVSSLKGQFLTQGPALEAFETALCECLGGQQAVVCNSGTAALHLIYMALGLGPQAGLVTSPLTFVATANAARMCGAPVSFSDTDPTTGLMTPDDLQRAIESADFPVRAASIIHLGGRVADLPALQAVAEAHNILLVEDACHAPGAAYNSTAGRHRIGDCSHSIAAAFSFHAIKHVTMGEGGAVLTNDPELAVRMRLLRNHGLERNADVWTQAPEPNAPWYYEMQEIGWNYRADELACSLGLSQLKRLPEGLQIRRDLVRRYNDLLADIPGLSTPFIPNDPESHAWHLYAVSIDFSGLKRRRDDVMRALADVGIGTQVHYIPVSSQPYFQSLGGQVLPGVQRYYDGTLSLPLYPQLTEQDQEFIADKVRQCLAP